jgi:hypothetical protein
MGSVGAMSIRALMSSARGMPARGEASPFDDRAGPGAWCEGTTDRGHSGFRL